MNPNNYYNKTAKIFVTIGSVIFGFALGYAILSVTMELIFGGNVDVTVFLILLRVSLLGGILMLIGYLIEKRS